MTQSRIKRATVSVIRGPGCATLNPMGEIDVSERRLDEDGFLALLRRSALMAVLAGGVGSFGLMLYVGRRQSSLVLIGLFTIWVLSPFMALGYAREVSKSWPPLTRVTLYALTLLATLGSLAIYGNVAFGPPRPRPAFVFLVVPLAIWLLMAAALPLSALVSSRRARRGHC